jgi:hypothetical protein
MKNLIEFIVVVWWFIGISVSHGAMTLLAILFPPYAMYLAIEKLLIYYGVL